MSQTRGSLHEHFKESSSADLQNLPIESADKTHIAFHEPEARATSEPEPGKLDQAQAILTLESVREETQNSV